MLPSLLSGIPLLLGVMSAFSFFFSCYECMYGHPLSSSYFAEEAVGFDWIIITSPEAASVFIDAWK